MARSTSGPPGPIRRGDAQAMTHDRSAETGITATQASGRRVHSYASPARPDHCAHVSALAFRPTHDGTAPTRSATPERAPSAPTTTRAPMERDSPPAAATRTPATRPPRHSRSVTVVPRRTSTPASTARCTSSGSSTDRLGAQSTSTPCDGWTLITSSSSP